MTKKILSYVCECGEDVILLSKDDWTECLCGKKLDRSKLKEEEIADIMEFKPLIN